VSPRGSSLQGTSPGEGIRIRSVPDSEKHAVETEYGLACGAHKFEPAASATAVLLGRPYVYGLAIAGEAGVREVLLNLLADFDLALGLSGCSTASDLAEATLTASHSLIAD
jgi:hypothetical protein